MSTFWKLAPPLHGGRSVRIEVTSIIIRPLRGFPHPEPPIPAIFNIIQQEKELDTNDLNPIHGMLRFDPESPRENITLTVRESDKNQIQNQRRVAFLTCDDETRPCEYLVDAVQTVTKMLCNYPATMASAIADQEHQVHEGNPR